MRVPGTHSMNLVVLYEVWIVQFLNHINNNKFFNLMTVDAIEIKL